MSSQEIQHKLISPECCLSGCPSIKPVDSEGTSNTITLNDSAEGFNLRQGIYRLSYTRYRRSSCVTLYNLYKQIHVEYLVAYIGHFLSQVPPFAMPILRFISNLNTYQCSFEYKDKELTKTLKPISKAPWSASWGSIKLSSFLTSL